MQVSTVKSTAKQKRISKKARLLANPDIKRWYEGLERGSELTAEKWLYKLGKFCDDHSMTPTHLIELAMKDTKGATDLIQDHIKMMEEAGNAGSHVDGTVKSVISWLGHFDLKPMRRFKIANRDTTPTLEEERVPDAYEIAEILNRGNLRVATAESLIAKAGLRIKAIGNFRATDGLMMKDLPDIVIQQGVAKCLVTPPMIVVRKTLSKAKHQYFTFLTTQGTKKLLAYLNHRLSIGESLNADSPVIAPDQEHNYGRTGNHDKKFLPTTRISRIIRESLRPRFRCRPYIFRSYFDTQLLMAEARGKIPRDFRTFFMGHKGNIEGRYTTNKHILSESLINEMRDAFKRCEEFLDLEVSEEDPLLKQRERVLDGIRNATPEKVQEILKLLGS